MMGKTRSLEKQALAALRDAVARVIEEHRKTGQPLAVWKDGKVVMIHPTEAMSVREKPARYGRK
ncbi:MAG: hypothetical protein AB1696_20000 [Planctomycetota bacterium]